VQADTLKHVESFSVVAVKAIPIEQEIAFAQLPEDVKMAYEESVFAQWEVIKVVQVSDELENIIYRITISNGTEEFVITVDLYGNIIG
jgi:hypothetical protein